MKRVTMSKSKPTNKEIQKAFEIFKMECLKWQQRYHLNDYYLNFELEDMEEGAQGFIKADSTNRCATIVLSKNLESKFLSEYEVKQTAFHEMTHLLLTELRDVAHTRWASPNEFYKAEEAVIRRLEKTLFDTEWNGGKAS